MSTCLKSLEMLGNFSDVKEMSGISVKIKGLSGKKSCHGRLPLNFSNYCINRLFSITYLVLCAIHFFAVNCWLLIF